MVKNSTKKNDPIGLTSNNLQIMFMVKILRKKYYNTALFVMILLLCQ